MLPARTVYLATCFAWGLLFWLMATVSQVYQVETVGLDALQLVLVGTALELSAFIFEVPTGVVADTWSRKRSVLIGYFLTGIGFVLMGLVPAFWALVLASVIWGLGWTFVSGALQAWLADEIGESEAAGIYLRGSRLQNYGAFIGILLAVAAGSLAVHYPILLAGLLFCFWSFSLGFLMPETGFKPVASGERESMLQTLKGGISVVRTSSTLMLLMIVGVVFGTFSEGYDRLAAAHLLRSFAFIEETGLTPVVAFGMMTATGILLATLAVALAERVVDTDKAAELSRALSIACALIILIVLVFALSGNVFLAIAMYVIFQPVRSVVYPLTMAWFNRNIPSRTRATVISMHSQSDALGQIAGGPGVGLLGRELGVRLALSVAALLLLPALWLYARAGGHSLNKKEQGSETE